MPLETEFYMGNYQRVLSTTVDSQSGRIPLDSVAFVIGSLTFRGRLDEALTIFDLFHKQIDEVALFIARFYLGINLCRHSRHALGRRFLAENLYRGGRHACSRIRFFAWQGAGYYRLVSCRYQHCLHHASRALSAALDANFLYGKALASDLMAHSQVGPGQIRSAGESFRRALRYAELLGDGGLYQAIRVSMVAHAAQHGFDPPNDVQNLENVALSLTSEDNYSKSRILLELARQHILRGALDLAKKCLDEACGFVYSSQNHRYGIILNMRYAFIMYNEGQFLPALQLLRKAAKNLDPVVDIQTAVELTGLESRILDRLGTPSQDVQNRLTELTEATGRSVCQRILQRKAFRSYNPQSLIGDDPLGDLVDISYSRGDIANKRIVDSGFLYLMYQKLGWEPGTSGLHIDLIPGSLMAYENGAVHFARSGISNVVRTLLQQLAKGKRTKEDLIRAIWHYEYSPLKHDQLIYTAVCRLRQLLGPYAAWIEITETGYMLKAGIRLEIPAERRPASEVEAPPTSPPAEDWRHDLNHRQLAILEELQKQPFMDARTCMDRFQISEASARRDLAKLFEKNLLLRDGKGRATRYTRIPTTHHLNSLN